MSTVKQWVKQCAAHFGIVLDRRVDQFEVQRRILPAKRATIVDIGAFDGAVVKKYRKHFPDAKIYAIEPCADEYRRLQSLARTDPLVIPVRKAVADTIGERVLHINRYHQTNSLYEPDPSANAYWQEGTYDLHARASVQCTTLDAIAAEEKLETINIVKIDAQGAELAILHGAERLLAEGRIDLVYLEVITCPTYVGQASFAEVVALLSGYDFDLWDIYDPIRGHGKRKDWIPRLLQADMLFFSKRLKLPGNAG